MNVVLRSKALTLPYRWLDTDQLVPARFCTVGRPENLAPALFHDLRASGDLQLQVPFPDTHRILVAGEGFASGSGREHAVWALLDAGASAVVAPSFGSTFQRGAMLNGLWPVVLDEVDHRQLCMSLADDPEALVEIEPARRRVGLVGREDAWEIRWRADEAARLAIATDPLERLLDLIPTIERFETGREGPTPSPGPAP